MDFKWNKRLWGPWSTTKKGTALVEVGRRTVTDVNITVVEIGTVGVTGMQVSAELLPINMCNHILKE